MPAFFYVCTTKEVLIIRIKKGKAKTKEVVPKERINEQITVAQVRLIDSEGNMIGILSLRDAIAKAEEAGLDLVEISPNAEPPVCRITDFSKYYYQKEKKAKEARKRQHEVQVKEIKFGPNTDEHDYNFKRNNAIRFLKQHNKVKFTIRFRGRQMAHKDLGYVILEKLEAELLWIADVDSKPVADRNLLMMVMSPKKDIDRIIEQMNPEQAEAVKIAEATPIIEETDADEDEE